MKKKVEWFGIVLFLAFLFFTPNQALARGLNIILDSSTPPARLIAGNSSSVDMAVYQATTDRRRRITDLSFTLNDITSVQRVMLKDGDKIVAVSPGMTSIVFSGLNIAIPPFSSKMLTVSMDFGEIGSNAGKSGANTAVTLNSCRSWDGGRLEVATLNLRGNDALVFRDFPVASLVPTNFPILRVGVNQIAKFRISAHQYGITWKKLELAVWKSTGVIIKNPQLYEYATGLPVMGDVRMSSSLSASDGYGLIVFENQFEQRINTSRVYEIRAEVTFRPTGDPNQWISTSIGAQTFHSPPGALDNIFGPFGLTWSDQSSVNHDELSEDWNNGFLVPGLPSSPQYSTK
jgi:hypothetical protein